MALVLSPPLVVTRPKIDWIVIVLDHTVAEAGKTLGTR
jgi:hypothetical protein